MYTEMLQTRPSLLEGVVYETISITTRVPDDKQLNVLVRGIHYTLRVQR